MKEKNTICCLQILRKLPCKRVKTFLIAPKEKTSAGSSLKSIFTPYKEAPRTKLSKNAMGYLEK